MLVVLIAAFYLPVLPYKIYNYNYKNVAEVKQLETYNTAQFISDGELNMQLIWKIGKAVTPINDIKNYNFNNSNNYLLFGYSPIEKTLSGQQSEKIKIIPVGIFDCNREKGDCKIYVNLIQQKL